MIYFDTAYLLKCFLNEPNAHLLRQLAQSSSGETEVEDEDAIPDEEELRAHAAGLSVAELRATVMAQPSATSEELDAFLMHVCLI